MIEIIDELKIEILIMFFSMFPLVELRGAIPLGISLGLNPIQSTIISILGNILVAFILLNILNPIMIYLKKTKFFSNIIGKIKTKSMKKAHIIKKYSLLGLFLFVSIPIPTTGAWTGALISSVLKLNIKKAFISISLGLILSGLIILTISHGLFTLL